MDKAKPIPWAEQLGQLEDSIRQTLAQHLQRELDGEYHTKLKNKAQKLSSSAFEDLAIAGEQLRALVREGAQVFRVDMTFPLFDLDTDFTLIRCTCLREALSLEALRCQHMFFLQKSLLTSLEAMRMEVLPAAQGPWDQQWDQILDVTEAPLADDILLFESRWCFRVDPEALRLVCVWERRARYGVDREWSQVEICEWEDWKKRLATSVLPEELTWQALIAAERGLLGAELFAVLSRALEEQLPLTDLQTGQILPLEICCLQLELREQSDGYRLVAGLGGSFDLRLRLLPGALLWAVAEGSRDRVLLISKLQSQEELFLKKLLEKAQPIPKDQREKILDFMQRLDPRLFTLATVNPEARVRPVQSMQPILRLTPFARGGMRIDVRLKVAPHLSVQPGEGDILLRDIDATPGPLWQRDASRERHEARRWVRRLDLELLPEPEPYLFIAYNDQLALDLMQRLHHEQAENGLDELLIEWPQSLQEKPYQMAQELQVENLSVSLGERKDWFQVDGWMALEDGTKLALKDVLSALRRQQRYIQLTDGRWTLVSEHFRQRLEPLTHIVEEDDEALSINLAALGREDDVEALAQFPFAQESKRFWGLVQQARRSVGHDESLPPGIRAELRSYQLDGYRWLNRLFESGLGACLADDMGLGKTLQTLALLLKKAERGPSLVIAPSSLSYNWAAEAARFCPDLELILLRELSDRGQGQTFRAGQVVIGSYGLLMRYVESLAQVEWNIIVFDEAQQIKNAHTKTAQAAQMLKGNWRLALSGTPIENRLSEIWSLFRTVSPGLFGEWERFRRSFVFPIERDRQPEAQQRLKQKLAPFVMRRMKKDYLHELPEKTELDLWIDLSAEEREVYDALRGEAIEKMQSLESAEAKDQAQQRIQVLAALTRLRQAACHRQLVDPNWEGTSSKIEILLERMDELRQAGHAALVFSQFTRFLKTMQNALEAAGLRVLYLDGQTPVAQRQGLVDAFQSGEGDVFLISLKAGGTGLNLTRASYVFHMDPWWNPAVEQQASDRAYRMGQKQAVTVYKLRCRQTIEEVIHGIQIEKKALMEAILEGRDPDAVWSWENVWDLLGHRKQKSSAPGLDRARTEDSISSRY